MTWRQSPKENGLVGVQGEHAALALPEDRRLPDGLGDRGCVSSFSLYKERQTVERVGSSSLLLCCATGKAP